jgi:hypothetical protein
MIHSPAGTVTRAVDEFLTATPHCDFAALPPKGRFRKPAA